MDEVLLDRPFLESIGFNLKHHLTQVYRHIDNKDVDEIDTDKVKLFAAKHQILSYMASDEYPIDLPTCLSAGISKDSKKPIDITFKNINSEAREMEYRRNVRYA